MPVIVILDHQYTGMHHLLSSTHVVVVRHGSNFLGRGLFDF